MRSLLPPSRTVQSKLRVSTPGDVFEREADRVADAVMGARDVQAPSLHTSAAAIQRMCSTCEDEQVQRKAAAGAPAPAAATAAVGNLTSHPGSPLPPALGGFMQERFGHDFSAVRLHTGATAAASAASLSARAFTVGRDIAFGAGEYAPDTREGRRLIAHELAHVVQQSGGAATPTIQREDLSKDKPKPAAPAWTPPSRCGPDFCRAFPTKADAIDDRDGFSLSNWSVLRLGISSQVAGKVMPLWDEWAAGGGPVRDITPTFGSDFTLSPTTATTTSFLLTAIKAAIGARTPVAPGATVTIPLATLIPTAVANIDDPASANQMNFNIPKDIPGNIAGGIGKDEAANPIGAMPSPQDDARLANGGVTIIGLPGGDQFVIPSISFTVKDTVDLCPGDCGAKLEQIATIPMSRWEATAISGDVPFTVDFPPPVLLALPFTLPAPGAPPKPPTPTPTPKKEGKR